MTFHFQLIRRQTICALCAIVYLAVTLAAHAADAERAKRVLIISTGTRLSPGFRIVDQQLLAAFARIPAARIETYAENLDLVRFPSERFQRIFTEYLTGKYADNPPDVVIFVFIGNLGAASELLPRLFPGIPHYRCRPYGRGNSPGSVWRPAQRCSDLSRYRAGGGGRRAGATRVG